MKKSILLIGIISSLIIGGTTFSVGDPLPTISIPPEEILITMCVSEGIDSYFDMNLTDVPTGYDVVNGIYPGWCIQKNMRMSQGVNHRVRLYLSYDPNLPEDYKSQNWSKINYIINNKQGDRKTIQDAIWHYSCNYDDQFNSDVQAIIDDADQNGLDFIPKEGELVAIILDGANTVQRTFFEFTIPASSQNNDEPVPELPSEGGLKFDKINYPPTADGTAGEPYEGFTNTSIEFDGSRSYDIDGSVVSWKWRFNDNTIINGKIIKHSFKEPGNHKAILIVFDNKGESDSYTTYVTIKDKDYLLEKPVIYGPNLGVINTLFDFKIKSTYNDSDYLQYLIEWGDGESIITDSYLSGSSIKQSYIWNTPGRYNIKVKALNNNSESEYTSHVILIDVLDVHSLGYLIDYDSDNTYDAFHSNETENEYKVKKLESGKYLIDSDGDEEWDYVYNPLNNKLSKYIEQTEINYTMVLIMLIICPILIIFIFGKKKKIK
jgi:hypothetical protein